MTRVSATLGPLTGERRVRNGCGWERRHNVAMVVSFLYGYFLSANICDFRPTRQQQYLILVCDSDTATFRVPQDKLDKF